MCLSCIEQAESVGNVESWKYEGYESTRKHESDALSRVIKFGIEHRRYRKHFRLTRVGRGF